MTIKELAALCGVSVATVSKSLNYHGDCSPETAQRVREMAKKHGYFPNSSARALKTSRSYNLGVLYDDTDSNDLTHDYFTVILNSFKLAAEAKGYDITFISGSPFHKMTYFEHSKYRGVDGLVIINVNYSKPEALELFHKELPLVAIDYVSGLKTAVVSDNLTGMSELMDYVCEQGHTRIAYIYGIGEPDNLTTRNRVQAYRHALKRHKLRFRPEYLVCGQYHDTGDSSAKTEQLLRLPVPPTCILYPDDFAAIGGLNTLKERGIRVPEDLSIGGYDGIRLSKTLEPNLTTYRQNSEMMGKLAAEKLIMQIEYQIHGPGETLLVKGELWPGCSVKKL